MTNRRFVAIGVPDQVRNAIEQAIGPVRQRWSSLGWTDPAGWHVTLAFLGALADARVAEAEQVIAAVVADHADPGDPGDPDAQVVARTAGSGRFGGRVLSLAVVDRPEGTITAVGNELQAALERAELPVSQRDVRPHLTLARGRHKRPVTDVVVREIDAAIADRMARSPAVRATLETGWPITRVGLWTAHDQDGPARYEVTAEVAWARR